MIVVRFKIKFMKVVVVFFSMILLSSCFNILGDVEIKELKEFQMLTENCKLKIISTSSNATIQPSIQVHKICGDSTRILKVYERYHVLDTAYFKNDSTLVVAISDTVSLSGQRNGSDTMNLIIK